MSYRCYTCSTTQEAAYVARCARPYCAAKKDLAKDEKAAQKRMWDQDEEPTSIPDHFDQWKSIG